MTVGKRSVNVVYGRFEVWAGKRGARCRAIGFDFDDVRHQFVRPADRAAFDFQCRMALRVDQNLVCDRRYGERFAIDDGVFDFDADRVEQMQGSIAHEEIVPRPSTRRRNDCMMRK